MSFLDTLRSPSPRRQIVLAIGLGVVTLGVLVGVYFSFFHATYNVLFKDLRTLDAATIVADLEKRKTPYQLADNGTTVLVPAKLVDATRLAVMSEDLPLKGVVGFELFNKSDMGLTEFAQKINYRRALQGELARTIMAIDSVESARVHLSLAESTVFRDDRKPSKASVSIIPRAGHQLSARTVSGIQHLMSAAVPDLEMADVVVLDGHGDVVSAPVMPMTETSPPSVGQKAAVEQYYSARLRLALQRYYPDDQLSVSVLADPMPPSGTVGAEQGRDVFGAWGPGSRKFALSVSIQITAPFGPEVRDQIQRAAAQAIDLGAAPGDTIRVASGPVAQVSDPSASLRSARGPRATDAVSVARPNTATPGRIWLALIPLLVVLLIVALLLHRLGPGPRRLSTAQRRAYAARLTSLLHPEVVRANSGF